MYQVVADEDAAKHHQLRVIDEAGEDYLYPEEYFVPVQLPQAEKAVLRAANLTPCRNNYVNEWTAGVRVPHPCAFCKGGIPRT